VSLVEHGFTVELLPVINFHELLPVINFHELLPVINFHLLSTFPSTFIYLGFVFK